MHLLYSDPQTRKLLEQFAKNYVHSESYLAMTQQVAHSVGEIGATIVIALITKRPSTFAPEVASSEVFTEANTAIDKLEQTLTDLQQCHKADNLSTDTEHVVVKAEVIEARRRLAEKFYRDSGKNLSEIKNELEGIDFNKPVEILLSKKAVHFISGK